MPNGVTLVNGIEYSHEDSVFLVNGLPLPSITSFNYDEEQDKENLSGAQVEPYARRKGPRNYSGSMTVGVSDYENILRQSGDSASATKIPMGIMTWTLLNAVPVNKTFKNFEFTSAGASSGSGARAEVTLNFIFAGIENL